VVRWHGFRIALALAAGSGSTATVTAEEAYQSRAGLAYREAAEADQAAAVREHCRLDLYHPTAAGPGGFATVVWFHGGGLKEGQRFLPERLKGQGIAVAAAGYRLYPEVKAPAYLEDAAAAVAWVLNNIASYGGSPEKVFVSGHSAGGYLASMIGLDKRWLAAHDIDADRLAGLVPLSGQTVTHSTVREERGIGPLQPVVDDLAPLYHVRPDAPPLLLITGGRDLELKGRYEENAYLWRMMREAGHEDTTLYELDGYGHSMTEPAFPLLLEFVKRVAEEK
jgi:acetyl esterase/lipase